ncbi:ribosome maturation factor RimP [Marinithermofilum abyssi]|uniref:Ribosome maturation factor RimP n=1 Tax=Marinithermofilum abyssi TaxID=1571185 RepID=A0A8J2VED3_9BACL|nr:ribosome maturation factor RimP [Marinithermofilum abyssi]GGE25182.1 ribosome maturation factor RimP [Marinithermofilum abyssi]
MSRKVTEAVEAIVEPILEEEGLELYETEFKKEGKNWYLRVYIDRPEGRVNLDDCSRISERLSKELDRVDPIPGAYFLEVSSPGAERPLKTEKHFRQAVGKHVYLTTYEPVDGSKTFEGKLAAYTPEKLTMDMDGETVEIPADKVAKARLAVVF